MSNDTGTLVNQELIQEEIFDLLISFSFFTRVEAKILSQLFLTPKITGKELSFILQVPDSKIYPALKKFVSLELLVSEGGRPNKYSIRSLRAISDFISEKLKEIQNANNEKLEKIKGLETKFWRDSSVELQEFDYFIKSENLRSHIFSFTNQCQQILYLFVTEPLLSYFSLSNVLRVALETLERRVRVLLILPPRYVIHLKKLGSNINLDNLVFTDYELRQQSDYWERIKSFNEINLFKIYSNVLPNTITYMIRDTSQVMEIYHRSLEKFAIVSEKPLLIESLVSKLKVLPESKIDE